jgi:hypothetical protein
LDTTVTLEDVAGTDLKVGQTVAYINRYKPRVLKVGYILTVTPKGALIEYGPTGSDRTIWRHVDQLVVLEEAEDPHIGCPSYPDCEDGPLGCAIATAPEDLEWYGHR